VKNELARLRALAVRVGNGDRAAASQLLHQLTPVTRRFVRRVIRLRTPSSPLAQRILLEAQRILADPDTVVAQVTEIVCQALVEELSTPDGWRALRDTLAD
jgi:hypothetical protein